MPRKKMPRSIRKFIRREKARIRREVLDIKEQEKQIKKLYENTGNTNRAAAPDVLPLKK